MSYTNNIVSPALALPQGARLRLQRAAAPLSSREIWWINPGKCLLFLILPIYAISAWLGGPLMSEFGSTDFLTPTVILTGTLCIVCISIGCKAGEIMSLHTSKSNRINRRRFDRVLLVLMFIAVTAHFLLLLNVLRNPQGMFAVLRGDQGAIYDVKDQLLKLVGLTSLVNITPLVLAMASYRKILTGNPLSPRWRPLFWVLIAFVLVRGFAAAERLAIVEAAIGYALPIFTYGRRSWKGVGLFPLAGIAAVFMLFALGEYTRSWAYYVDRYDNFLQFASLRLLGYISVASNTAAGLLDKFGSLGYPYFTATWAIRLPELFGVTIDDPLQAYFASFGNEEYNNPGGVMASVLDYGLVGGLIYCLAAGAFLGWFYGNYMKARPIGLFGYPCCFIGIAILTQGIYWGDPRFLTLILAVVMTVAYVSFPVRRHHSLAV